MKRLLIVLGMLCISISAMACDNTQEPEKIKQDSLSNKHTILDDWAESLDKRKFSEDSEEFKQEVKEFGDDVRKTVKEYTPEVENFMKSLSDYFKR